MPEIVSPLAPCRDDANFLGLADEERPDRARGTPPLRTQIGDGDLSPVANGPRIAARSTPSLAAWIDGGGVDPASSRTGLSDVGMHWLILAMRSRAPREAQLSRPCTRPGVRGHAGRAQATYLRGRQGRGRLARVLRPLRIPVVERARSRELHSGEGGRPGQDADLTPNLHIYGASAPPWPRVRGGAPAFPATPPATDTGPAWPPPTDVNSPILDTIVLSSGEVLASL
jgi:hypothetical protein